MILWNSSQNEQITVLNEANLKLSSKNVVYVMNSGGQLNASNAARLLATQSAKSGRSVVLCDTTGQSEKDIKEKIEQKTLLILSTISTTVSV